MNAYGSRNEDFDDFEWEDNFFNSSQSFEKFENKKSEKSRLTTRRQIEDIQERRAQKKRQRMAMDEWDDLAY